MTKKQKKTKSNSQNQMEKKPSRTKQQQLLFDNLLRVTYEYIAGKKYYPQSKEDLINRLRIHPDHLSIFDTVLRELKEKKKVQLSSEKYIPLFSEEAPIITGKLLVHPRGFGFVQVFGEEQPDVFIPKPHMNEAIDGDVVEVQITNIHSEKGPEGKILSVIKRTRSTTLATITSRNNDFALGYSSLLKEKQLIHIYQPKKEYAYKGEKIKESLSLGDRVIVEIHEWGTKDQPPKGAVVEKIGNINDPSSDIPAALIEYEIPYIFPSQVIEEAEQFGNRVRQSDLEGRKDFRSLTCITIDPDTAKDYDDALSLVEENGYYILGVHIADVSYYVQEGSYLDEEAKIRANSTYFPGICIPMLPHVLSDNLCSLKQGVNRLTVSVMVKVDKEGSVVESAIYRSVIKSARRYTYKEAKDILDKKKKSNHFELLSKMLTLCELFKKKRSERGSVQLYIPGFYVHVNEKGEPTKTEVVEYDVTHQLVEEFMLKANEIVATRLSQDGKNVSFRIHEEPAKESLREFAALCDAFGHVLSQDPTPQELQNLFIEAQESPHADYLATCYIRSMKLACYSPDNIGHYGLGLDHYCHFTSPIRRYIDLHVHRLLFSDNIDRKITEEISEHASNRERISAKAESSVMTIKKLRLLKKHLDSDPEKTFEAVVTRIKPFGIYFDVLELMLEGFLHVSEINDDYFVYSESTQSLSGRHTGLILRSGIKITLQAKTVDLILQQAEFKYVPSYKRTKQVEKDEHFERNKLSMRRFGQKQHKKKNKKFKKK